MAVSVAGGTDVGRPFRMTSHDARAVDSTVRPRLLRQTAHVTTLSELALLARARPAMAAVLLGGRALRRPLVKVPGLGWVTSDPVVSREILKDGASFTILDEGGVGHLWGQILGEWVFELFDGPGHHDLRTRARDLFTKATATAIVDDAWGASLAAARRTLAAGGTVDVGPLSRTLVGRMMTTVLGIVPPPRRASDAPWPTDAEALETFRTGERLASVALGTGGSTHLSGDQVATARGIVAELTSGVPDGWAHAPAHLLLGRCRELGLSLEETTGIASLLMVAGTETSASAMARTTALLIDTGEQTRLLAGLARGEALWDDVVREGLRVTSPASVIGRGVAADVEVAGRTMRAGERVMMLVWSANTAPGPFRVDRPYLPDNRQLWFGAGRHLCLGAALARAELEHLLRALFEDGPLEIVRRRAQARVIVPTYRTLEVRRVG